jgi:hypothetical protein
MVKKAMALALGDSWKGHRIVGAGKEYADHYGAELRHPGQGDCPGKGGLGCPFGQSGAASSRCVQEEAGDGQ